jgi:hypothetical protein
LEQKGVDPNQPTVAYCRVGRQKCARIEYDDSETGFCFGLPWFKIRSMIEQTCAEFFPLVSATVASLAGPRIREPISA